MEKTIETGLNDQEVEIARQQYGWNVLTKQKTSSFWHSLIDIITEPMFLLLVAASVLYFLSGAIEDGFFMLAALLLVTTISIFQENRAKNALNALKKLTQPQSTVIRNGIQITIASEELVPGDLLVLEEGQLIPADGQILQANDFSVNESILTGESFQVSKSEASANSNVYQGTITTGGRAICQVYATGNQTELGKIGKSLESIQEEQTPLQRQISQFVQRMAIMGSVVFLIVWAIHYLNSRALLESLLKSLTLAMSVLPEEIPVAFTTFMALGAWRLLKMGILVKHIYTVEALGSATVLCTDKTGTLTENRMELARIFSLKTNQISAPTAALKPEELHLIQIAMWASEPVPFDAMEKALHTAYLQTHDKDERSLFQLVHEYPLDGQPPMMTHVFKGKEGQRIIAAKGAPEALIAVSKLSDEQKKSTLEAFHQLAEQGYRVLGVGESIAEAEPFPERQQELPFHFLGLVAFYDPPKPNISAVLEAFYAAGIQVKIITGDNHLTTASIARQIGLRQAEKAIDGASLMKLSDEELAPVVRQTSLFTRMFPEAKLRIVQALKRAGHIVAMTGDGVNDGPALKAAHIGIAMGQKGTEIARQASSLVLIEDDLARMVDALAMGRKIYANLKKAIQYIISIHIPILLTVLIPLALGWKYPSIFTPVHVIFLEMIMGPTCSIVYENEPMSKQLMNQPPRPFRETFFRWSELAISILQGLGITIGILVVYAMAVQQNCSEATTRTLVFCTLVSANIGLTLVNRSFHDSILTTFGHRNPWIPGIIGATILLTGLLLLIPTWAHFFGFETIHPEWLATCIVIGLLSVLWFELEKWRRRVRLKKEKQNG
jgi:Ca2+-transporting ATPase